MKLVKFNKRMRNCKWVKRGWFGTTNNDRIVLMHRDVKESNRFHFQTLCGSVKDSFTVQDGKVIFD